MAKLEATDREALSKQFNPDQYMSGSDGQFRVHMLRVLLSIDERLAETNDFYLQNQEERNRPNG